MKKRKLLIPSIIVLIVALITITFVINFCYKQGT